MLGNITDNAALIFANPFAQTFTGTISGSGSVTKSGNGTLTLNAANSYSGDTTISAGTLKLGVAAAIPSGAGYGDVVDNGTLDLNGKTQTVNGLSGSGSVTSSVAGAAAFTVGGNDASSTFSGIDSERRGDGVAHQDRRRHADSRPAPTTATAAAPRSAAARCNWVTA